MRSRGASHAEIFGPEGAGQEFFESRRAHAIACVDQELVTAVLEEELTAAPTRRNGLTVARDNGRRNQASAADTH
jgi:hypothetical protein